MMAKNQDWIYLSVSIDANTNNNPCYNARISQFYNIGIAVDDKTDDVSNAMRAAIIRLAPVDVITIETYYVGQNIENRMKLVNSTRCEFGDGIKVKEYSEDQKLFVHINTITEDIFYGFAKDMFRAAFHLYEHYHTNR